MGSYHQRSAKLNDHDVSICRRSRFGLLLLIGGGSREEKDGEEKIATLQCVADPLLLNDSAIYGKRSNYNRAVL
jgi:hypothetical protein